MNEIVGGTPRVIFHEDINGALPIKEVTVPRTTFKATQSGQAIGYLGYPPLPPPLFPDDVVGDPVETYTPAVDGVKEWTVAWQYSFESATPLVGRPHFRTADGRFQRGS